MNRGRKRQLATILSALGVLFFLRPNLGATVVTIAAARPIEQLAADGRPTGVSMAKIGAAYALVKQDGTNLILQDSSGGQYLVALDATDYTPAAAASPTVPVPAVTNTATPATTAPAAAVVAPPASVPLAPAAASAPIPGSTATLSKDDQDKLTQMNAALGIPLLADMLFWQNNMDDVAQRLDWPKESQTDTEESYRLYATPKKTVTVLGASANSLALYGKNGKPTYISIIFANAGDFQEKGLDPQASLEDRMEKTREDLGDAVKKDAATITNTLTPLLGDPTITEYGNSSTNRDEVHRWDWKDVAILLNSHNGEYTSVKIVSSEVADRHGTVDVTDRDEMRDLLAKRVVKRNNGDVIISQLPMVDQGPKGYCVPATWERYLRYMDLPADLYVLAIMGNTGLGGGTNIAAMQEGVEGYVSAYHRRIETYDAPLDVVHVAKYIDQGLPLMWTCWVDESVELRTNQETQDRKTVTDWTAFANSLHSADKSLDDFQAANGTFSNGHERMIIGYNAATNEIAISDSWGERFAERWMYAPTASKISQGQLNYLSW
jgi:hypothetical protein